MEIFALIVWRWLRLRSGCLFLRNEAKGWLNQGDASADIAHLSMHGNGLEYSISINEEVNFVSKCIESMQPIGSRSEK